MLVDVARLGVYRSSFLTSRFGALGEGGVYPLVLLALAMIPGLV